MTPGGQQRSSAWLISPAVASHSSGRAAAAAVRLAQPHLPPHPPPAPPAAARLIAAAYPHAPPRRWAPAPGLYTIAQALRHHRVLRELDMAIRDPMISSPAWQQPQLCTLPALTTFRLDTPTSLESWTGTQVGAHALEACGTGTAVPSTTASFPRTPVHPHHCRAHTSPPNPGAHAPPPVPGPDPTRPCPPGPCPCRRSSRTWRPALLWRCWTWAGRPLGRARCRRCAGTAGCGACGCC
jgi:hypothetical protein